MIGADLPSVKEWAARRATCRPTAPLVTKSVTGVMTRLTNLVDLP